MRIETPLIGRDADLSALREALAGDGGFVLVSGEAGIGKSRLVREAVREAAADGRPLLWGRPEEVTRPGPFALVLDLVENAADAFDGASDETDELIGELSSPAGEGAQPARRIAARVRGLLSQIGEHPIIVLEDLHSADDASHSVVLHLARAAADDGFLLVGTYRPEEIHQGDPLGRLIDAVGRENLASTVALSPLSPQDSIALASAALGGTSAEVERIAKLAEGVPFFLEELASASDGGNGSAPVPDTIARAVLSRQGRIGEAQRRVVRAAALGPGAIDADVLAVALDLPRSEVSEALVEATRAGLTADREGRLVFRHALVRESIAADLVSVEREDLHRRIAEAIERVHAADLEPQAQALARHWYNARDRQRAMGHALTAASRALGLGALAEARAGYELALACGEPGKEAPEALAGLAEVEIRDGRPVDAQDLMRKAADEYAGQGRAVEAALALGRLAWMKALQGESGVAVLEEALQKVGEQETDERARLIGQLGAVLVRAGEMERGVAMLQEAIELGKHLDNLAVQADALDALALCVDAELRQADAVAAGEEAVRLARLSNKAELIGKTHINLATLHGLHGEPGKALELVSAARTLVAHLMGSPALALLDMSEAAAQLQLGRPDKVLRLSSGKEIVWQSYRTLGARLECWASLHQGDRERATSLVERLWRDIGPEKRAALLEDPDSAPAEAGEAIWAELVLQLELGDPACWNTITALKSWHGYGSGPGRLSWGYLWARGALVAGEPAGEPLGDLAAALAEYPSPYFHGLYLELTGTAAEAAGEEENCIASLREAVRTFEEMENYVDRARSLRILARALAARDRDLAIQELRTARALALEAGSVLEVGRIEADMRAHGIRPRAGRPRKGSSRTDLSPREEEVAVLVAAGSTNAEIAARLFLSERTVQDHITNGLRKLSLSGRAGLAAWAARRGLV